MPVQFSSYRKEGHRCVYQMMVVEGTLGGESTSPEDRKGGKEGQEDSSLGSVRSEHVHSH